MVIGTIIAGALALTSIVKGFNNRNSIKKQADFVNQYYAEKALERRRQADKLASTQKVRFLKSGVNLAGTPLAVINETYNYANADISDMFRDSDIESQRLRSLANQELLKGLTSAISFAGNYYTGSKAFTSGNNSITGGSSSIGV